MMRMTRVLMLCLVCSTASAQSFLFDVTNQSVDYDPFVGAASFTVQPTIDQTSGTIEDTQAFSMGVSHDSAFLDVISVSAAGAVAAVAGGSGPDFFGVNIFSNGFTVGCVYQFDMSEPLQYASPTPVLNADYDVDGGVLLGDTDGASTTLNFSNTLATPDVLNVVVIDLVEFSASLSSGTITFNSVVSEFLRGDIDGNGNQSLADAVAVLVRVFSGPVSDCEDAYDVNDDGSIDVADGVYELNYLFTSGPAIPAPSAACGLDATADGLDCSDYASCP